MPDKKEKTIDSNYRLAADKVFERAEKLDEATMKEVQAALQNGNMQGALARVEKTEGDKAAYLDFIAAGEALMRMKTDAEVRKAYAESKRQLELRGINYQVPQPW